MRKKRVVVGSRDSKLAVIQSQLVMDQIAACHPEIQLELVTMKTTGDRILDRTLDKIGGKGLFVKELDKALRCGQIDLSVHSLKDMPMEVPEDLPLLAFSKREHFADVLVLPKGKTELDPAKPLGTSSARRRVQLEALYPGLRQDSIRGNVLTRLEKLDRGEFGGLILAQAGLSRLELNHRVSRIFSPDEMIPAAGQGILVIQGRSGEDYDYLNCVDDRISRLEAAAERAFVTYLEGGCSEPIGAFAKVDGTEICIRGLYYDGQCKCGTIRGDSRCGEELAIRLAKELKGERK